MATYRAIGAVCEAVLELLRRSWRRELFDDAQLQFKVFRTRDFATPIEPGVSLFLYRVAPNGVQRTSPAGERGRLPLPLDLSFLLTPWAGGASLEQEILAWLMRTLEDHPILPSGLLNSTTPDAFGPNEVVEVVAGQLSPEELFRMWDVLPNDFQVSVPYLARVIRVYSDADRDEGVPVLERQLDYGLRGVG